VPANSYDRNVSVTRVYDAPRALVFEAWTRPEHLTQWFAPRPYTLSHCELELRPGGKLRYAMRSPDGIEHWVTSTYREIVIPERLEMTTRFADLDLEFLQTVTFAEHGAQTTVAFAMVFPDPARLTADQIALLAPRAAGARIGSTMSLEQLAEHLAKR
jgi:uncharacterized protein YndB with AHSA1/START domain